MAIKQKPRIVLDKRTKDRLDKLRPSEKFTYDDTINMLIDLIPSRVKETIEETKNELNEGSGILFTKMVMNKLRK